MAASINFGKLDISSPDVEDWFDRFSLYCLTNEKIDPSNRPLQTAYLLTFAGPEAYKLVKDLAYPRCPNDLSVDEIRKFIVGHVKPQSYEVNERAKFYALVRRKDQSVKDFILQLNRQAAKCEFTDLEIQLRDRLVAGINDSDVQKSSYCTLS